MINFQTPSFSEREYIAVQSLMESGWVGPGAESDAFLTEFARHARQEPSHFAAVSSCTDGLFFVMQLVAARRRGEIIIPSICYAGVAHAAAAAGLRPRFCDVDGLTLNATADTIAEQVLPDTVAIVVLHYGGHPCEMERIVALARHHDILLIEDAACTPVSFVGGRLCGTIGDYGVWSFDAAKLLTAVEGGFVYAQETQDALSIRRLANLGMECRSGYENATVSGKKWWDIASRELGRRSVLPDLHAAIGRVQLARVHELRGKRRALWRRYYDLLEGVPGLVLPPAALDDEQNSFYYFWTFLAEDLRDRAAAFLLQEGVFCTFKYPPLHQHALYRDEPQALPRAERIGRTALLLPLHANLSADDVDFVCGALVRFLSSVQGD